MLKRRLRFGPSAEQEDRFRPAHLEAVEWDRRLAVGDDRLLRFLTPQRLWFLPPVWRWGSEEDLRQANEQLEEKIRERTEELLALNENLVETRDQLRSLASDLILTEAREKRALASELHDTVAQMLAIAKLTLESTGARLEGKSREEVKRVVQILQEAS